jgi:hypothetical protein
VHETQFRQQPEREVIAQHALGIWCGRFINVHTFRPNMRMRLLRDSTLLQWRGLAKEGMDLPPNQRAEGPSEIHSSHPALAIAASTSSTPAELYWCRGRFVCVSRATFQTFGVARDRPRCAAYFARCAHSGLAIPEKAERMERHDAARQCPVPLRGAAVLSAAGFSSRKFEASPNREVTRRQLECIEGMGDKRELFRWLGVRTEMAGSF